MPHEKYEKYEKHAKDVMEKHGHEVENKGPNFLQRKLQSYREFKEKRRLQNIEKTKKRIETKKYQAVEETLDSKIRKARANKYQNLVAKGTGRTTRTSKRMKTTVMKKPDENFNTQNTVFESPSWEGMDSLLGNGGPSTSVQQNDYSNMNDLLGLGNQQKSSKRKTKTKDGFSSLFS